MRDTHDTHHPINAIEAYVKQTRDKFRSEDLYIHLAKTLYTGLGREDEVASALHKHLPQGMPEVPLPVLGCCAGTDNIRLAIEHCLDTEEHGLLPYGWQYSTQQDVSRLCIALADVKGGDTVLMPFFGLGNDAAMLPQGVTVQGYEIDERVWALARINLWAHEVDGTGVKCADAFKELENLPDGSQQRIIMSPSFDNLYDNTTGTIRAIELGLSKLAPDGKMVVVTPSRLALDDRAKAFRNRVSGKLQSVISIPAFGSGSTMPSCVWVFDGQDAEEITFVDGTDFGTHMRGDRALGLAVEGLINAIRNKDSEYVLTLPSSEIDVEGFYPPRLMVKRANETASDSDGTQLLRSLLEMIPPRHSKDEELPGIPMAALSDNFLEAEIHPERCVHPDSPILREITGPAILVSVSSRIRVGWWKEKKPVAIPLGVAAMRLRSDKLNPLYLLRCILSTDTHRQLLRMSGNALGLYTGGRSILPRDLLDVRIPVPPLAEQERIVREEAMRSFANIQSLVEQGRQQALKLLASHRHQLSNNFLALSCDIDVLRTMMNRNGSLTPDMEINPFTHTTVGQLIDGLEEKCQTVNASIAMLKDLTEDMCREINLNKFFNKMLSGTSIGGLDRQLYEFIENCDTPEASILFPEKSLTRICENIFTNARKYAFVSVPSPDHDRIRITWRVEEDTIVLDIANNGAPLAIPSEEVLKAGATTAKDHVGGQGGFEIDNRMRLFDGSVEVLSQPDEEWPVTYRLTFKNIRL